MKRLILIFTIFALTFSAGQAFAQQDPNDPGDADTIWFCPESLYVPVLEGDPTGFLHIMLVNDDTVGAVSTPLIWTGTVTLDSVTFKNTRVESLEFNTVNTDVMNKKVLVSNIPVEEEPILPGRGKIGTLVFSFDEMNPITLDTIFFPPINTLRCVTLEPVAYTPQFRGGSTPIPIIIYTPGDVNKSGVADVSDIVHITNYVLKSGPEPDPLIAGDVNADCIVDIVDAVYLVNYVFKMGPAPLPGCTSVDDC
jgi:hypothetical protein